MKMLVYELLFHLIIVIIFADVFLGLMDNAFEELRVAETKANYMNNILFICQIDLDTC